jgi:hypothetical protein
MKGASNEPSADSYAIRSRCFHDRGVVLSAIDEFENLIFHNKVSTTFLRKQEGESIITFELIMQISLLHVLVHECHAIFISAIAH